MTLKIYTITIFLVTVVPVLYAIVTFVSVKPVMTERSWLMNRLANSLYEIFNKLTDGSFLPIFITVTVAILASLIIKDSTEGANKIDRIRLRKINGPLMVKKLMMQRCHMTLSNWPEHYFISSN
ncbi:MAG: hypothetical protein DI525_03720 [Corynebacterium kroppenstedtii]|uniref:Uncharacterized protein n=1 Tax=Corynebacterium kroppenstedtii TaxID=161879 RepID=A0A2W5SRA8_9CORY|nr:MAG: hypothetical protein DI525_03720 [Corynebacterium kroppenstedtii]